MCLRTPPSWPEVFFFLFFKKGVENQMFVLAIFSFLPASFCGDQGISCLTPSPLVCFSTAALD